MSSGPTGPTAPGHLRGKAVTVRLHRIQTSFRRQSIPVRLWVYVVLLGFYSAVAAAKELTRLHDYADFPSNMHALLGVILSVLLVFRTNTAYDRWWEGRKLWGQLVNDSRSLIAKVRYLVKVEPAELRRFTHLVGSLAHALKEHLRGPVELQGLPGFAKHLARPQHVPVHILSLLWEWVGRWKEQGRLDVITALMLDRQLSTFSDVIGGCDRIRNTPLSQSYRTYVRLCLFLYLVTLPWGLEEQFRFWTVPAVMIVSFFMLGLEMIARAVEEPFGTEVDDLPLDELCWANEATLNDLLRQPGEPETGS